ncbi:hypothetical protein PENSPDRAFT_694956 [Peniophora sp. CONT]|nr:hypothetical protein PENSPDRAFT_694956 [Peniophora sp. CONT]
MSTEWPKCRHCRGATIAPTPAPVSTQTSASQQGVPPPTRAPSPPRPSPNPAQTAPPPVSTQTNAPHTGPGWTSTPSTQKVIARSEGMTEAFNDFGLSDEEAEEEGDSDDDYY